RVAHGFVHAVERAKQCGLAAARWADKRGDFIRGDTHADIEQGLLAAVEEIDLVDVHAHGQSGRDFPARRSSASWSDVYGHCRPPRRVHGLGPRDRDASSKYRSGENIDHQNQTQKDKPCGPSLTLPILVRGDGIDKYHMWKGIDGLVPTRTPVTVAEGREEQ